MINQNVFKYSYLSFCHESQDLMLNNVKNTYALFSEGLLGRLRQGCRPDWQQFMTHSFVKELGQGILPADQFKRYLVQDYLYLLDYSRVEALAIYKSNSFDEMQYFSDLLKGLIEVELPLHLSYCKEWGIEIHSIEKEGKSLELIAYSQYLLTKSMQGDLLDIMIILLPCLVGYGEIGLNLLNDQELNRQDHPYLPWIEVYSGEKYYELIQKTVLFLDEIALRYGAEQRYPLLLQKFREVVQLETRFWDVGKMAQAIK